MSRDLSEVTVNRTAIQQEVVRRTCRSPVTLTSAGAGALLLTGGLLTGFELWLAIAAGLLMPAGFLFNYLFRATKFSREFIDDVARALDRRRQRRLGEIRADLYDLANELKANDEAGDLASRALEQFGDIHRKFDLFLSVLDRKLSPGELAHARYLRAADQFFMQVMQHLGGTAEALQIVSTANGEDDRSQQIRRVEDLLAQNAEALTAFDATITSLGALKDLDASEAEDLRVIRQQLEKLAEQAERLGRM